jgi:hypothetical protein
LRRYRYHTNVDGPSIDVEAYNSLLLATRVIGRVQQLSPSRLGEKLSTDAPDVET